ncbi:MAG: sensor histidine kinase [Janthinobacterium lividum]
MRTRVGSLFTGVLLWAAFGAGILSLLLLWQPRLWIAGAGSAVLATGLAIYASRTLADQADALQGSIGALPKAEVSATPFQYAEELAAVAAALEGAAPRLAAELVAARESGLKLEALLNAMQDAVTSVDAAGRISWANRTMQQLVREAHGSVRLGHSLVQTVRAPEVLECVQIALESREQVERRPVTVSPGRIVEITAAPMPGGGAVIVMHDISRIEQVERTQREFVANVSHELRTPLTSIQGYVEMLLEEAEDATAVSATAVERQREFLEATLKSARRMARLTDDLLALARVESGEQKFAPAPIAVSWLVEECLEAISPLFKEKGGTLALAGEVPEADVLADADAILQILSNLVENALNYGRGAEDWPVVELSARIVGGEADGGLPEVQFRVRDFGGGIALEHQIRLFERFYRVDKARSRESGGTGLGLAIARHIVEAHHGRIWVESELGQGSSFIFSLPCVVMAPTTAAREAELPL